MTNKLFGTDGVRGVANVYPMNAFFAFNLAEVLSSFVCKDKKRVATTMQRLSYLMCDQINSCPYLC